MVRVYVGSFKDTPLVKEDHAKLFERDRDVLLGKVTNPPLAWQGRAGQGRAGEGMKQMGSVDLADLMLFCSFKNCPRLAGLGKSMKW